MTPLRRLARLWCLAVAWLCTVLATGWAAAAAAPKTNFRLPVGDAASTLRQFSQQARTPIVYPVDAVRGVTTNAVQGEFTAREALDRMVTGTGLVVAQDGKTGALTVGRPSPPAAPAPRSASQPDTPSPDSPSRPTPTEMKTASARSASLFTRTAAWIALAFGPALGATGAATGPTPPAGRAPGGTDPIVQLNPFTVTGSQVSRYQAAEAASGGRLSVNLFDSTKNLGVITGEFMADVGAGSPLHALKFLPGIARSTQPEGAFGERISLRGFQTQDILFDGFRPADSAVGMNQASAFFERIEVVMGADSILSPSGQPGGTINVVTKRPRFDNFGNGKLQWGRYNTNRASLDLNRIIQPNLAARVIIAGLDNTYFGMGPQRGFDTLSGLSWRFANGSLATVQYRTSTGDAVNGQGTLIDPSSGTDTEGRIFGQLSRDAGERLHSQAARFRNHQHTVSMFFDSRLSPILSTRLAGMASFQRYTWLEGTPAGSLGGSVNPLTGKWTPGFTYGPAPAFNPTPATFGNTMTANVNLIDRPSYRRGLALQNDYALELELGPVRAQTAVGFSLENVRVPRNYRYVYSVPTFDVRTDPIPGPRGVPVVNENWQTHNTTTNAYANQVFRSRNERLTVNLAYARSWHDFTRMNYVTNTTARIRPKPEFVNYGVAFKLTSSLLAFYGHSENAQPNTPVPGLAAAEELTSAKQEEGGIRFRFRDGKAVATLSYYRILQDNFPVLNQANFTVPPPTPRLRDLLLDRKAEGWEFGVNAALTDEWSMMASYSDLENRQPNGVEIRGTPEQSGSLWLHLAPKRGVAEKFAFGAGVVYQSRSPGDTASGATAASTQQRPVPVQPSFYVPESTLLNLTVAFRPDKRWVIRGFIDNVFDEDYIVSATRRTTVYAGTPRNYRVTIEHGF
jgi:iron complex outermembrane receptor protein